MRIIFLLTLLLISCGHLGKKVEVIILTQKSSLDKRLRYETKFLPLSSLSQIEKECALGGRYVTFIQNSDGKKLSSHCKSIKNISPQELDEAQYFN